MRIGHGFDVHAFGGAGPIIIGGVRIPFDKGLLSHSDGDVVLHAISDALLGASALGDIGRLFPNDNPAFKNANSRILMCNIWQQVHAKGYLINNIDVTILAQEPKLLPYITQMRIFVANDLNCCIDSINIKSTTMEKLGFIGRNEGIACEAIVLLQ